MVDTIQMCAGCIGQMTMGCLWPVFSILFSNVIAVMLENDSSKVREWYCACLLSLALDTPPREEVWGGGGNYHAFDSKNVHVLSLSWLGGATQPLCSLQCSFMKSTEATYTIQDE